MDPHHQTMEELELVTAMECQLPLLLLELVVARDMEHLLMKDMDQAQL